MKKQFFFVLLFLASTVLLHAQSNAVNLYGFRKQATGGMQKRGDITENGKVTKIDQTQVFQYAIYLTSASKKHIYPIQLWINGNAFSVKAELITKLLRMPTNSDASAEKIKPLIPKNAGNVWKLTPTSLIADKSNVRTKTLAMENAVIVQYKVDGKTHYGVLKKFTDVDDALLQ